MQLYVLVYATKSTPTVSTKCKDQIDRLCTGRIHLPHSYSYILLV